MKCAKLYLLFILILSHVSLYAQTKNDNLIHFNGGTIFSPPSNISKSGLSKLNKHISSSGRKAFVIIQLENIPGEQEKALLEKSGITLLEYVNNRAYTAIVKNSLNPSNLHKAKVSSVFEPAAGLKIERSLAQGVIPKHAVKVEGMVDIWVNFVSAYSADEVKELVEKQGYKIVSDQLKDYHVLTLRIPRDAINNVAELEYVQYIQAIPGEDKPINDKSRSNSRANVLNYSLGAGRNLKGSGVVIGVGDDANPVRHVDFNPRIINNSGATGGTHGVHVIGTVTGAGIQREQYAGYAPKATVMAQYFSLVWLNAPTYVKDYGMVLTNNSYGPGDELNCTTFGTYDLYSQILDQQAFQMPNLQHVFAAGNSGSAPCSPYPSGYSNVLGGYQSAKNIITVGNTSSSGLISAGSSRGPVKDGRIKPEIVAQGTSVSSTYPGDQYTLSSGTSMSSPAVTGGLALLYERYKQLHSGQNPKNGLMKALVCNGATDLGNPGPDYQYGFGWMNLLRSVTMLENNAYRNDSLINGATQQTTVTVPANTAQLKVMLYWNDPAASVLASQSLVNDLDLTVTTPANNVILPLVLFTDPATVNTVASPGVDHINNIEQVVINNPAAGNYTVSVKGTSIVKNPRQPYFIAYDAVPVSLTLTSPLGGEAIAPAETFIISWDEFGNTSSTFNVQYSVDNGANWTNLVTNLVASARQYSWTVPSVVSGQVKVKVIQNSTGAEVASEAFTIIEKPVLVESAVQCEGYFAFEWAAVTGATDYEVMVSNGLEMVSKEIVSGTSYTLGGLSKDSTYYVSVRCRVNTKAGRRAHALKRIPNTGTCTGSISNNDLKIDAIVSPASNGRKLTSTELLASQPVIVRIKNLDDISSTTPFIINYLVNNNVIYSETINPTIAGGGTYDHTFPVNYNFSGVGSYAVKAIITRASDPVVSNNVLSKTFKQLPNNAVNIPFNEGFESLSAQSISGGSVGLAGGDRYDFVTSGPTGRIRSFMNSGIAYSGTKAMTLDVDQYTAGGVTNNLIGTFNLANYQVANHDIRLDFKYKNHGQSINNANRVWLRGSDTGLWIEAYDLNENQLPSTDGYQSARAIEISRLLSQNGQNFTSSFQIKWGQYGENIAADYSREDGYTFDNVQLYTIQDDIQLLAINAPAEESCNYGNQEIVQVTVRNSSPNDVFNVPIKLMVDGNSEITETISHILPQTTITYSFTQKANLSSPGSHSIRVTVDYLTDDYPANDMLIRSYYQSPPITSLPYYEDFEANNGFWHSGGENNSWQYGSPGSPAIRTAASGTKAWKTNLSGNYNNTEHSYLYSPCITVSGIANPTLSFSVALDLEVCDGDACDIAYVEYSGDGGVWTRLDPMGNSTNWYNKTYAGVPSWSVADYTYWHVATSALPTGFNTLRLRFVMSSDPFVSHEGIAIDDIHVYDNPTPIYDESTLADPISQSVPASNNWVHFKSNNKLIASVKSGTQDLGSTNAQVYINTAGVRNNNDQYYLDRNIAIKPTNNALSDSVTLRLYFLDAEMQGLLDATGCTTCGKPTSAYTMGIAKYSSANAALEDGEISNNVAGNWLFKSGIKKVPFDKGYYAEFKVANFSEFWFANGALNEAPPLPVVLSDFTAKKNTEDINEVILNWKTTAEVNSDHFEIELAKTDQDLNRKDFRKIGEILAHGESEETNTYQFIDTEKGKSGNRYYRLKMVDKDGSYAYSAIRAVAFEELAGDFTYPNPSSGAFFFDFKTVAGIPFSIKVVDNGGKILKEERLIGDGLLQNHEVDLSGKAYAAGIYIIEVESGFDKRSYKAMKN